MINRFWACQKYHCRIVFGADLCFARLVNERMWGNIGLIHLIDQHIRHTLRYCDCVQRWRSVGHWVSFHGQAPNPNAVPARFLSQVHKPGFIGSPSNRECPFSLVIPFGRNQYGRTPVGKVCYRYIYIKYKS